MSALFSSSTAATIEPVVDNADPFANLAELRLSQSFIESAGAKKLLTTVTVRKPNKQDWVRTHPEPDYRMEFAFIELKDDRELYLIHPSVAVEVANETFSATLYTAISRQRVLFLWPVRLPPPDGRELDWHRSAREAAELAMSKWIRLTSNMALGAYDTFEATGSIPDPEWPKETFQSLLRVAFPGDRFVGSLDHPVLKRLRGE
jgi:hypothetical protein